MITLSEKEVQELLKFIDELPFKHGLPLHNFFVNKIKESKTQQETIVQEEIKD